VTDLGASQVGEPSNQAIGGDEETGHGVVSPARRSAVSPVGACGTFALPTDPPTNTLVPGYMPQLRLARKKPVRPLLPWTGPRPGPARQGHGP
jgi:hypothetical protein